MRLTLRTLLAYLDDVLSHAEAEVLQKRIDESEFAATLVQRIRHAVKRLRLSAPKVDGKGIGFDANSVADYLDSVLPTERMAEFERVCLESDIHLAEVAACHQILCKVLKEPAHVSPELRDRIHKLPALAKAGQIQRTSARHAVPADAHDSHEHELPTAKAVEKPVSVASAAPVKPVSVQPEVVQAEYAERPKLEVPDYLKPEPSTSRWQLLGVLAFMAIAAVVLLMMSPLGQQFWSPNTPVIVNVPPLVNPLENQPGQETPPVIDSDPQDSKPVDNGKFAPPDKLKPLVEEKDPNKKTEVDPNIPPAPENVVPPQVKEGPPKIIVEPKEEMPLKPDPEKPAPGKTDLPLTKPVPETSATTPDKEPLGGDIGRYISDETVLARFDDASKNWLRVRSRTLLQGGERIVSLPVFRPQIALSSGMQVTLVGEASVAFNRGVNAPISLQADHGKFIFVTAGVASASIELNLQGIRGQLSLSSADAEVAIEVQNYLPPGEDPATATAMTVFYIFPLSGTVTWKDETGESLPLKTNSVRAMITGREPFERSITKLPTWIDVGKTLQIERDAAKAIEPLLQFDRPLLISLEELATHRKVEVRSLTAKSLATLEYYQLLLRQLSEEEYKSYWNAEIELLRTQVARGGTVARELESQLVKQRGEKDGAILYRLLWGFSEEQLLAQDGERLVAYLDNIHPDVRLLAFDNLRRITGVTHSYHPNYPPEKNRSALLRWTRARKEGEIAYAVKPSPIAELYSLMGKEEK